MAKGGFPGGRMPGGMNMNMIKQAQRMQQEMLRQQQEIEEREFAASAGGGMVTATVNGKRELLKLDIDPDAVIEAETPEDVEMLSGGRGNALRRRSRRRQRGSHEGRRRDDRRHGQAHRRPQSGVLILFPDNTSR